MEFSFVIPCYASEKTISNVVAAIHAEMDKRQAKDYQIVLVNDCSPDGTWRVIRDLAKSDSSVVAVDLAKNVGQHGALMEGFRQAKGDYIITVDDDMQTPIERFWDLKDKIDEGYDVVSAKYAAREGRSLKRSFGSWAHRTMKHWIFEYPNGVSVSSFFIARSFIIQAVLKYDNPYPYVSGLILQTTNSIASVDVVQHKRAQGSSGYSLKKLIRLFLNAFTSFSVKPLRVAWSVGAACLIAALISLIVSLAFVPAAEVTNKLMGVLFSIVVMLIGLIFIALGLIGEYVGRIYISINNAPQSVVREIVGN